MLVEAVQRDPAGSFLHAPHPRSGSGDGWQDDAGAAAAPLQHPAALPRRRRSSGARQQQLCQQALTGESKLAAAADTCPPRHGSDPSTRWVVVLDAS